LFFGRLLTIFFNFPIAWSIAVVSTPLTSIDSSNYLTINDNIAQFTINQWQLVDEINGSVVVHINKIV